MTTPAVYKFVNWITGTPVPIDDGITSALTPTVDAALLAAFIALLSTSIPSTTTGSDFKASGVGHAHGLVPDPGAVAGTTKFLREDATFATPPAAPAFTNPTVQSFLTGSGNYTPTAGVVYIKVRMCAGGGGGGATVTNNGNDGNDSSFGTWTALKGIKGNFATGPGGLGGTGGTNGTGTLIARFPGGKGQSGVGSNNAAGVLVAAAGGIGGMNPFGGSGVSSAGAAGTNGATNTGAGGGGAGTTAGATGNSASGGGAGEYVEFFVFAPGVLAYVVGAGGNGGAAGTLAGGNGATGCIIIEEHYG